MSYLRLSRGHAVIMEAERLKIRFVKRKDSIGFRQRKFYPPPCGMQFSTTPIGPFYSNLVNCDFRTPFRYDQASATSGSTRHADPVAVFRRA